MRQKAYCSGSEYPELKKDTLRIYSSRLCPYAERARLVLAHKNIPHEVININLRDKPEWFLARAPEGKVPVLQKNDTVLWESTAVSEYLDDAYPGDRLQPTDPCQKAKDRILLEHFGEVTSGFYGILFNLGKEDNKDVVESKVDQLHKGFQYYEQELVKRGSPFFGGTKPSMIDMFMWPHLERMPTLTKMAPQAAMAETAFPKLVGWWRAMTNIPAIQKEMFQTEWHLEVYKLMKQGKHGGDYGLEE